MLAARARRNVALACALIFALAGCAGHRAQKAEEARILDPQELYRKGAEALAHGEYRRARTFLDRIQYAPEGRAGLEPLVRLALADIAFYTGDDLSRIDARAKYLDFVTLYGDHPRAPYAQLQAGVCSLSQVNAANRDQSQTLVAINDLKDVERRYPTSPYVRAAHSLIVRAESSLVDHDFGVGRFYFKRKAYLAASERFRSILTVYPNYPQREKVFYYLGWSLLLLHNDAEGRIYLDKVVSDYPHSPYAADAKRLLAQGGDGKEAKDAKKG
jgi:outer membrane protein assembly factor BamD